MFFQVVAGGPAGLYKDLLARNIELAVCRMIGPLPGELAAEILFHDSLVVMTAAKNPLTRRRKLTLAELADEPWSLYPAFFEAFVADAFREKGLEPPRGTVSSLSFNVHAEMLATGRFLTVMPSFMLGVAGRNPPLKALPVTLPNSRMPVGIITLKNRTLTPIAQLFIESVRSSAKELTKRK